MSSKGTDFTWEVALAAREGTSSFYGRRPTGSVVISTTERGEESIRIPARVAKSLSQKEKSGELDPSSRAELLHYLGETCRSSAWTRLSDLLNRRDYSSAEARRKLRDDGYSTSSTDYAVRRAVEAGLIDDARFADVYIRSKIYAGWGQRKIERELSLRGVEPSSVPGWPWEYLDPDSERERAYELAQRKVVSGKNRVEKMARFLMGRGFSTSVAFDVAKTVEGERSSEV